MHQIQFDFSNFFQHLVPPSDTPLRRCHGAIAASQQESRGEKTFFLAVPIAFDEKVTYWLQCARSLPCACVLLHRPTIYLCD